MLAELREWIGRDGAASSSRTAVPVLDDDDDGAAHTRLKSDETDSSASVTHALNRLGPGPRVAGVPKESCGNPSTWLPELQSCETWVRTNPLAGLPPLPKPHWGWGFDPGYIDTAGKPAAYHDPARNQTAATMRALLTDLARITGSLSADIGSSGPDCAATEAARMKTLVEICTAAMQAHGTRQPQLSIRLSPWYLLRQTFLLILSPFRSTDLFGGAGTSNSRAATIHVLPMEKPPSCNGCGPASLT